MTRLMSGAHMDGFEGVINAAGVLRGELESVHHRGPMARAQSGSRISCRSPALGAGTQPDSHFLATKHAADLHLLELAEERRRRVGAWFVLSSSGSPPSPQGFALPSYPKAGRDIL